MNRSPPSNRPRADARRNRASLLASAHATFQELGANASLDEVARRAGVGSGTLYRHFATREELIEALFEDQIATLVQKASDLLSSQAPGIALVSWLQAFIAYASSYHGLADVLSKGMNTEAPETLARWYDLIRTASGPLLVRAQDHHEIRADLTVSELLRLMNAAVSASQGNEQQTRRFTMLIIEGIQETTLDRSPSICVARAATQT